jgi:hypothetical protein
MKFEIAVEVRRYVDPKEQVEIVAGHRREEIR